MTYTTSYQLPQWVDSDRILRTDFNDAFQKLETALTGLDSQIDALDSQVEAKGNCILYTATYVGTGGVGSESPTTLTFPQQPLVVFISSVGNADDTLMVVQGATYSNANKSYLYFTWSGNSLQFFSNVGGATAGLQMNESGVTYRVVALIQGQG